MKNFKTVIVAFLLFTGVNSIQAQNEDNKWALSFGVNAVDFNNAGLSDVVGTVKDYLGVSDWNTIPAISTISVSRYTNYGLSVRLSGSLNKIDSGATGPIGSVDGSSFFAFNVAAVYDLNSLFGETAWFDPYVSSGFGGTWVDDASGFQIEPGLGFNTWFNENVGLSFTSIYSMGIAGDGFVQSLGSSSYFQHSVGLIICFNGDE
jgi:hypothetical protein